jgi:glutaredoxin 3
MTTATEAVGIAKRRVEIFSAGCQTCQRTIEQLREQIDSRHEIVVHDMSNDKGAAEKADAFGIRTVPAVVVDGFLLDCCKNKGPTLRELHAAGLAKPGQFQLEAS